MNKLLEMGEIGLLQNIPAELTFMANENNLLKHENDKLRVEKSILIFSLVALVLYIIWSEIEKKDEKVYN